MRTVVVLAIGAALGWALATWQGREAERRAFSIGHDAGIDATCARVVSAVPATRVRLRTAGIC